MSRKTFYSAAAGARKVKRRYWSLPEPIPLTTWICDPPHAAVVWEPLKARGSHTLDRVDASVMSIHCT
jgi:hypothetical protein